jgi:Family of unknown function (DUF6023)
VTSERARGAVLYGGAALLLAAGGLWWIRAKPVPEIDPDVARWTATAERLLPEPPDAEATETVELGAGAERQVDAPVDTGNQRLSVVCVGESDSIVRVSLGTIDDSGRGLHCAGEQPPTRFEVFLLDHLHMNLNVSGSSPVVFRYSVVKIDD